MATVPQNFAPPINLNEQYTTLSGIFNDERLPTLVPHLTSIGYNSAALRQRSHQPSVYERKIKEHEHHSNSCWPAQVLR